MELLVEEIADCAICGFFISLAGAGVLAAIARAMALKDAARSETMGGVVLAIIHELRGRCAPDDMGFIPPEAVGVLTAGCLALLAEKGELQI